MKLAAALCILIILSPLHAQTTIPARQQDDVVVDATTGATIDAALKWLVAQQLPNGSFAKDQNEAAITAYCMLAMMANGSLPDSGPYAPQMDKALRYLLTCVHSDGYIAGAGASNNMYGHGISTIVLGELYGQSRDPTIRPKLERAIKLIIRCQNKEGGWRYQPVAADADISVTVLQVVALRVAKNAGLDVPQSTIDRAVAYVKSCNDRATGGFKYQPSQPEVGFARTAAAIYSLQMCGLYDDPLVKAGQRYLIGHRGDEGPWFAYGHFYAAPAMYMIGGDSWKQWYQFVVPEVMKFARRDGDKVFWEKGGEVATPVWSTAVFATVLALPYHYLPIYQK